MDESASHVDQFTNALEEHAARYGVELSAQARARLGDYYKLLSEWNARLHLVAPCSPAQFATRHALESLLALSYLPHDARVADVGSGAGLPVIPCLIARPGIHATLYESSQKKAVFLREALRLAGAHDNAKIINERFEKTNTPPVDFITCRALDRFEEMFDQLLAWSPPESRLLLYGGHNIGRRIESSGLAFTPVLIPDSEQRFLFVVEPALNFQTEKTR
ncbi:MAG: 16S rRNA (guanine(527)-N(7))-methyltransferase RsmG [Pyrinomonadaceae bacterium]